MTNIAAWLVALFPLTAVPAQSASLDIAGTPAETLQQQQPPPYTPPPPPPYTPPPPPQYAPPPPPPPQPFPRREKQRHPWYVGFGLGSGDGAIRDGIGSASFGDYFGPGIGSTNFTFEFQLGATLSPKLLLGADWMITGPTAYVNGAYAILSIQTLDAVVTFFPAERGFFVRGGGGFASYWYDLPGAHGYYGGLNLLAGLGYAFWLGRSFNLTLNLDYSAQTYPTGGSVNPLAPHSSWFWAAYVGFAWY